MSLLLVAAILVGMGLPLQAGINAQLRLGVGHPLLASLVSFAVGTLVLALATLLLHLSFPPTATLAQISWWQWTGGLIGAVYIFAAVILAPRLGATTFIGAIVAGQMVASLLYDHYGVVGFPVQPITWPRIIGVVLIGTGVWLIQSRRG